MDNKIRECFTAGLQASERFKWDIASHKRLEDEPRLFTRSEVIEFMKKAITMQGLQSKQLKDSELDSLLP